MLVKPTAKDHVLANIVILLKQIFIVEKIVAKVMLKEMQGALQVKMSAWSVMEELYASNSLHLIIIVLGITVKKVWLQEIIIAINWIAAVLHAEGNSALSEIRLLVVD